MKVFRSEDFKEYADANDITELIANIANARLNEYLEKEAKKVYGNLTSEKDPYDFGISSDYPIPNPSDTHQAYLVAIEPIERCKHPKEKVRAVNVESGLGSSGGYAIFIHQCECGAKVVPSGFEEVK